MTEFSPIEFAKCLQSGEVEKCVEIVNSASCVSDEFLADAVHSTATLLITNTDCTELLQLLLRKGSAPCLLLIVEQLLVNYSFERIVAPAVSEFCCRIDEFRSNIDTWDQIVYSLPFKLEKVACALVRGGNPEGLGISIQFLRMYSAVPELNTLSFREMISVVVQFHKPDDVALKPFLSLLQKRVPFHPYIVYNGCSSILPNVFSPLFIFESIISALNDYCAVSEGDREHVNDDALCKTMEVLLIHFNDSVTHLFLEEVKNLLLSLFPYIQNFALTKRVDLMKQCETLISRCNEKSRVVILKRLIEEMSMVNKAHAGESMILAWLIDLYRLNLNHPIFVEELGSVWSLLATLRFEDPIAAASFYISVFNLGQAQALRRLNIPMIRTVKKVVMDSIREQIRDFTRLESLKENAIGPDAGNDPERYRTQFNLLVFNMNYVDDLITGVLSK